MSKNHPMIRVIQSKIILNSLRKARRESRITGKKTSKVCLAQDGMFGLIDFRIRWMGFVDQAENWMELDEFAGFLVEGWWWDRWRDGEKLGLMKSN